MFVVAGLGNPGEKYKDTRHNIGFMVIDRLAERAKNEFKKGKGAFSFSKIVIGSHPVLLVKPLTFMNLSGQAIQQVLRFYKIDDVSKLLVVVDDFHLPFGTTRLRPSGSAAGQKGLKSILQILHTDEVARLRIGIGAQFRDAASYVLSTFNKSEQKWLPELINWSADAVESFVEHGIDKTMNNYNGSILDK